jgi:hypothetical protein
MTNHLIERLNNHSSRKTNIQYLQGNAFRKVVITDIINGDTIDIKPTGNW